MLILLFILMWTFFKCPRNYNHPMRDAIEHILLYFRCKNQSKVNNTKKYLINFCLVVFRNSFSMIFLPRYRHMVFCFTTD